ncbi:MAG: insulinase family protein [Candidatus Krumholzibacteria bacterium]|nr:insulinase family protein [Candidatus Krumholzibacteria bacterium]MDH4337944.1 insulinase family protein [Candidatus Krumholzibacteria bacterium]MDH5270310.1 insulinase family protein [Candidatus Krumholzibacteria bacterium]
MKSIRMIGALLVLMVAGLHASALAAKQEPPAPEPMKKMSFPAYSEMKLKNGLEVVVVEHHEQPVASLWLAFRAGSTLDPEGKSSLASFTGTLLNKGTRSRDSKALAEWIESVGGSVNVNVDEDDTVIAISLLSEYLPTAYEYLADIVLNPTFPEDELSEERKRAITGIEFEKSDPNAMADRHFHGVVYGKHPYAIRPTTDTVEDVSREDVVAFHARNYVPNNALLFVVGDVKDKQVKKDAEKYFGSWKAGTPDKPQYAAPPERTAKNISLYHRPGSVQTNVYIGHLGLKPTDPDWPAVTVANRVLGGGASGRLFMNIREDKGWTYGAYSNWTKPLDAGYFRATANVRTEVTDSSLTEMLAEITRIVDQPVDADELESAKSYLVGNFPTTIETPSQIAAQIGQVKLLGLDKSYLENYRKYIATVTAADAQAAMQKHLHPDRLAVVLVGDATEIKDKVEPIASVALYDIEGNAISLDELAVQGTDFDYDTSALKNTTATYAVKYQEMNLGDMNVSLEKTGDDFASSSTITGMISMKEEMTFGGDFEPRSYSFSMAAGPQTRTAELAFADGRATGRSEGGKDGPKDIDVELVQGMILKSAVDVLVSTLHLEAGATFKFPVLDAQSGGLENVSIEVMGEEDVMVPAGSYATFKVRVKSGDGEQIMYVQKASPHWMVKQEVPAQGLNIELKSIKM